VSVDKDAPPGTHARTAVLVIAVNEMNQDVVISPGHPVDTSVEQSSPHSGTRRLRVLDLLVRHDHYPLAVRPVHRSIIAWLLVGR
jgi:hypothetical protein